METQSATAQPASLVHQPPSFFDRLDWARVFEQPQPVEVELGCGDSTLIVELARRHPERNFLGVERLRGRLKKLDRKGRRAGLTNLRGLRIEAAYSLEYLLPPQSVSVLHIYFPDPWPKRKHWPNRLINGRFTELAAHVLVPGGMVCLRTDDAAYFKQMTEVFGASTSFVAVETPAELLALPTDFERDFQAKGVQTNQAAYRRK
ncbi:MAG: tRNA (guanosine(46)-N7)-methyltransferase TrmB [Verrucomicrobia bacterium]|nr:tRNA (guanosine(46)-N7)-methyltransferase TrmB [Verrucomicrobiota bacterium]